jgi:hypothetical protein
MLVDSNIRDLGRRNREAFVESSKHQAHSTAHKACFHRARAMCRAKKLGEDRRGADRWVTRDSDLLASQVFDPIAVVFRRDIEHGAWIPGC